MNKQAFSLGFQQRWAQLEKAAAGDDPDALLEAVRQQYERSLQARQPAMASNRARNRGYEARENFLKQYPVDTGSSGGLPYARHEGRNYVPTNYTTPWWSQLAERVAPRAADYMGLSPAQVARRDPGFMGHRATLRQYDDDVRDATAQHDDAYAAHRAEKQKLVPLADEFVQERYGMPPEALLPHQRAEVEKLMTAPPKFPRPKPPSPLTGPALAPPSVMPPEYSHREGGEPVPTRLGSP
jgi:hypothetical protein